MNPYRCFVDAVDPERFFGNDAQTEILQHRQNVGERDRLLRPIESQSRQLGMGGEMQRDLERRAGAHSIDPTQVRHGLSGVRPRLISDRKRLDTPQLGTRFFLAESAGGRLI